MNFEEVFKSRRSVINFDENSTISKEDLNKIFTLTSLSPSCFNLQHTHYRVITNKEVKEEFRNKVCPQYKIHSCAAVILVLGDVQAYKKMEETHGYIKEQDPLKYNEIVENTKEFYETKGKCFPRHEAIRNASLSAMSLMLIAKSIGYDTCPMMGFDYDAAIKFFDLPDNLIPVLLITLGYEDKKNIKVREPRKDIQSFVKIID